MNVSKQTEKEQAGVHTSAPQPKDQNDCGCNFNNDYYGDRVCHDPSSRK